MQEDISVKNNSSKTVCKVYEIFCICRDVFFKEYVENKPGYCMAECSNVGNGITENLNQSRKRYSLNQMLHENVAFASDVCFNTRLKRFFFPT